MRRTLQPFFAAASLVSASSLLAQSAFIPLDPHVAIQEVYRSVDEVGYQVDASSDSCASLSLSAEYRLGANGPWTPASLVGYGAAPVELENGCGSFDLVWDRTTDIGVAPLSAQLEFRILADFASGEDASTTKAAAPTCSREFEVGPNIAYVNSCEPLIAGQMARIELAELPQEGQPLPPGAIERASVVWESLGSCGSPDSGGHPFRADIGDASAGTLTVTGTVTWFCPDDSGSTTKVSKSYEVAPLLFEDFGWIEVGKAVAESWPLCLELEPMSGGYAHYRAEGSVPRMVRGVGVASAIGETCPNPCTVVCGIPYEEEVEFGPGPDCAEIKFGDSPDTFYNDPALNTCGDCKPVASAFEKQLREGTFYNVEACLSAAPPMAPAGTIPIPTTVSVAFSPQEAKIAANIPNLSAARIQITDIGGAGTRNFEAVVAEGDGYSIDPDNVPEPLMIGAGEIRASWDGYFHDAQGNPVPPTTGEYIVSYLIYFEDKTVGSGTWNYSPGLALDGLYFVTHDGIKELTDFEIPTDTQTEPVEEGGDAGGGDEYIDPVSLDTGEFYLPEIDLRLPGRGMDFVWGRTYRSQIDKNLRESGDPFAGSENKWQLGNAWSVSYLDTRLSLPPYERRVKYQYTNGDVETRGFRRIYKIPTYTVTPQNKLVASYSTETHWVGALIVEQSTGKPQWYTLDSTTYNPVQNVEGVPPVVEYRSIASKRRLEGVFDWNEEDEIWQLDRFELRFPEGGKWVFRGSYDGTASLALVETESRDGHAMTIETVTGIQKTITDTVGRKIDIHYYHGNDPSPYAAFGKIQRVAVRGTDTSIEYRYYGEPEDLEEPYYGNKGDLFQVVRRMRLAEEDEEPTEITTQYTYTTPTYGTGTIGNLVSVTDGRDNTTLLNEYSDETNPDSFWYDRIKKQTWGDAGDDILVFYEKGLPPFAHGSNLPATHIAGLSGFGTTELRSKQWLRAVLVTREKSVVEYWYDESGRARLKIEYTGRFSGSPDPEALQGTPDWHKFQPTALHSMGDEARSTDPSAFVTRIDWSPYNGKARILEPEGNSTVWVYEKDLDPNAPPEEAGNVREVWHLPSDYAAVPLSSLIDSNRELLAPADPLIVVERFTWVPESSCSCVQNLATRTDSRGNVTFYEHEPIALSATGKTVDKLVGIELPIDAVYPPTPGDKARIDLAYNGFGQLYQRTLPAGDGGLRRVDSFVYGSTGASTGLLTQVVLGGTQSWTLSHDEIGGIAAVEDPDGNTTVYSRNEYGLPLAITGPEILDGSGIHPEVRIDYDGNANAVKVRRRNITADNNGDPWIDTSVPEWLVTEIGYETLNRPETVSRFVDATRRIVTAYGYDRNRKLTSISLSPDTDDESLPGVVDSGNRREYKYDERGLLFQITQAANTADVLVTQLDYDRNGRISRAEIGVGETDARVWQVDRDEARRTVSVHDPMGNLVIYGYEPNTHLLSVAFDIGQLEDTDCAIGNVILAFTQVGYDALGRVDAVSQALYDPHDYWPANGSNQLLDHLICQPTDAAFDANAWLENALDQMRTTQYRYFDNSSLREVEDTEGNIWSLAYDGLDRLESVVDELGNEAVWSYDSRSNVVAETMNNVDTADSSVETLVTEYTYDNLDRLIGIEYPDGATTAVGWTSFGRPAVVVDPRGNVTRRRYDGLGRLLGTSSIMTDTGDGTGIVLDPVETALEWDVYSRLVSRTDPNGGVTAYDWDVRNRLTEITYPDLSSLLVTAYTSFGEPEETIDQNGTEVTSAWDKLGRLTGRTVSIPTQSSVSDQTTFEAYRYDGASRLIYAEDDDSVVKRRFDSAGDLLSEIQEMTTDEGSFEYEVVYGRDTRGNATGVAYPGGAVISRSFDALSRPLAFDAGGATNSATTFYRGPGARVSRRDFGDDAEDNFVRDIFAFDSAGFPAGMQTVLDPLDASEEIAKVTTGWDLAGNRSFRTDHWARPTLASSERPIEAELAYDSIDRLVELTETRGTDASLAPITWDLDPAGSRDEVEQAGVFSETWWVPTSSPTASAELHQYGRRQRDTPGSNGNTIRSTWDFEHDANGNITEYLHDQKLIPPPPGDVITPLQYGPRTTMVYDYRDRLTSFVEEAYTGSLPNPFVPTAEIAHRYDAFGRRIATVEDGFETRFVHDGWTVIEEHAEGACDSPGVDCVHAIYVEGGTHVDDHAYMRRHDDGDPAEGVGYWFHQDDHGNVVAVTREADGQVAERVRYDSFGTPAFLDSTGTAHAASQIGNPYAFTGRRWDATARLYDYRLRWYSPELGRFITRDPIGDWGDPVNLGNGYSYVGNSPWTWTDPWGLAIFIDKDPTWYNPFEVIWYGSKLDVATDSLFSDSFVGCTVQTVDSQSDALGQELGRPEGTEGWAEYMDDALQEHAMDQVENVTLGSTGKLLGKLAPALDDALESLGGLINKRGPKPKPHGIHNETITRRIQELKDEGMVHRAGGDLPEEVIETPGGIKSARRPDLTMERPDGSLYRENVGNTCADGTPIKREREALNDLEEALGDRPGYTPKPKSR